MKSFVILFLCMVPWSIAQSEDQCLKYRDECRYPEGVKRPDYGEYNYHRINSPGECNGGRSNVPKSITTFNTTMRILQTPTYRESKYKTRWDVEYKVNCGEDDLVYLDMTDFHTRSEMCRGKCIDFVRIDRGGFGSFEICHNSAKISGLLHLASKQYTLTFRSGRESSRGQKWVTEKGFEMYSICVKAASSREKRYINQEKMTNNGCHIDQSTTISTDLFPGSPQFQMNTDLNNFHEEWQRMKRQQPETELNNTYILHNQTVNYMDGTIYVYENGTERYTFEQVKILKTFDSTGDTAYHRGRVRDSRSPHFHGPGPLVIVCNCAFFQLFAVDPRGIVPTEAEKQELEVMYTPFLGNRSIVNHTELQKVYDEIYSGSDSGEKPTIVPAPHNGTFTKVENESISTAHINRDACNPVLRAQSDATLQYYTMIDATHVASLEPFNISCTLTHRRLKNGHCIAELNCNSQRGIEQATCQVNDKLPEPCDPFIGTEQFSENDYITVTAVNSAGQRARVVLSLK